ncbi:response regulator transcription factor [Draconibacterium sediminis]|uniref:response regulator transcription factor n=1 Tax=Draconibacterium sediminis TaxID=1544798 RepID=UPI0026EE414E|nr:response regulator transcription factor [Draconibacterium sediminis]
MKVLIVEDEKGLLKNILAYLSGENYVCEATDNYDAALEKIYINEYDCFVIDIMLGANDGLKLIEEIKKRDNDGGVIIISAKNSLEDVLKGLNLGADDYLTKPFHLSELNARIKAILRRRVNKGYNTIQFKEIAIELNSEQVLVNEKPLNLTTKEYQLLLYLITNKGKVLSKQSIVDHLWPDEHDFYTYDFIYTHLANIRKKLSEAGCKNYVKTVYGIGYKFN